MVKKITIQLFFFRHDNRQKIWRFLSYQIVGWVKQTDCVVIDHLRQNRLLLLILRMISETCSFQRDEGSHQ